jgi:hypothetical protein
MTIVYQLLQQFQAFSEMETEGCHRLVYYGIDGVETDLMLSYMMRMMMGVSHWAEGMEGTAEVYRSVLLF